MPKCTWWLLLSKFIVKLSTADFHLSVGSFGHVLLCQHEVDVKDV